MDKVKEIMNVAQFCQLPFEDKTNYLWDNGICVNQRVVRKKYIVCIFDLGDFYVEAIYSKIKNKVNKIVPVHDWCSWETHVDSILHGLLNNN